MMHPEQIDASRVGRWGPVVVAWILVTLPLGWGVVMTVRKALLLFSH